jgi:hypothetical protein
LTAKDVQRGAGRVVVDFVEEQHVGTYALNDLRKMAGLRIAA